jgi:hypothetical protein
MKTFSACFLTLVYFLCLSVSVFADAEEIVAAVTSQIEANPDQTVAIVTNQIQASPEFAGLIVKTAIEASEADEDAMLQIIAAALEAAPEMANDIIRAAIAASPNSLVALQTLLDSLELGIDVESIADAMAKEEAERNQNPLDFPGSGPEGPIDALIGGELPGLDLSLILPGISPVDPVDPPVETPVNP